MIVRPQNLFRILSLTGVVGAAAITVNTRLNADPPASTQPNILQQLSNDTQKLYQQSRHSMVMVQLPAPQLLERLNQQHQFLQKWGPLMDPNVRKKITEEQQRALEALHTPPTTSPLVSPSTQPIDADLRLGSAIRGEVTVRLFAVGVLVDDQGHAVFPVYVDRKFVNDSSLPAFTGDGETTTAKFIGSDAWTNLTVLQLARRTGSPAPLGHRSPDDGALTMTIASDGAARMVVWNNQHPDPGLAFLPDGSMAGFGESGHFLGASTARPIVDQLIATGEVHRALLGVKIQEVGKDDPIRHRQPELGASPAIRVTAVAEHSAAARGGVQADDLILSIGDETVGDWPTFAAVIATRRGNTVLRVLRGSQPVELTVNLQPNP